MHRTIQMVALLSCMFLVSEASAWVAHGGGFHGGYHGGGMYGYHGGAYHSGYYGYHGGYYGAGVYGVGVPIYGPSYYAPSCNFVRQCYPNGNCIQTQICD